MIASYVDWNFEEDSERMDDFKLARIIKIIMNNLSENITELEMFTALGDDLFVTTTSPVCKKLLLIYSLFYAMPLIYIIFSPKDEESYLDTSKTSCLVIQSLFFLYELL